MSLIDIGLYKYFIIKQFKLVTKMFSRMVYDIIYELFKPYYKT